MNIESYYNSLTFIDLLKMKCNLCNSEMHKYFGGMEVFKPYDDKEIYDIPYYKISVENNKIINNESIHQNKHVHFELRCTKCQNVYVFFIDCSNNFGIEIFCLDFHIKNYIVQLTFNNINNFFITKDHSKIGNFKRNAIKFNGNLNILSPTTLLEEIENILLFN